MFVRVSVLVQAMGVRVAAVVAVGVCVRSTREAREIVEELYRLGHIDAGVEFASHCLSRQIHGKSREVLSVWDSVGLGTMGRQHWVWYGVTQE